MSNKVLLKKSSVAARAPLVTDLDYGELALNYADGKLYYKNASNAISSFYSGGGTVTSVAALTLGTTGTDVSSSVVNSTTTPVITLNIPTASSVNRGVLSAADWTAFNSKQAAGSYLTSSNGVTTFSGGTSGLTPSVATSGAVTLAGTLAIANGGTGSTTASTARTNLGSTTIGSNFFTLTNPTAITFPRINADNTVSTLDAATFRSAIGAGTSSTTGTVTSVSTAGTVSGLTLSGGPITTTGTITLGGTLAVTASNFDSQTANTVLAAPDGSTGVPTFRNLTLNDLPDAWVKKAVGAATTAALTINTAQATIDGVTLSASTRVLIKNQAAAAQNGIYTGVTTTTWTRTSDADTASEIAGAFVNVDAGTVNGGKVFDNDFKSTDVLGTTAMNWSQNVDAGYFTTVGNSFATLANPTAITFPRINADNTVSALTAAASLTALGAYPASNPSGYTTNTGTVTGVTGTTPIISSGGTAPNITHATSGVTAGTYNNVTVNTFGHVTAGSNTAYLTAEADTLATVTARGDTTGTIIKSTSNSASALADGAFNVAKTIIGGLHFNNGGGAAGSGNQAAITFQGSNPNESQSGIYVHNNGSTGTFMAFATTQSYAIGPQIALTLSNTGVANFPRGALQQAGNQVLHAGNYSGYALPISGGTLTGRLVSRQAGVALGTGNSSQLEINNAASGACNISFHREGVYGAHFGLDTDNWFSTYGWSAGTGYTSMRVGALVASGNVTANSDERLKKDWAALPIDFVDKLALIKIGTYTRTDSNERQVGTSAQSLKTLLPEAVIDGEYLSVAYGNAALVSAVELAKKVVEQESRIARLEALVLKLIEG